MKELAAIKNMLQLLDDDFVWFHAEECTYLESLKQPPVRDQLAIRYTEALNEVEQWKYIVLWYIFIVIECN